MSHGRFVHEAKREREARAPRRRLRSSAEAAEYLERVKAFTAREFPGVDVMVVHIAFSRFSGPPKTRADLDRMRDWIDRYHPWWLDEDEAAA